MHQINTSTYTALKLINTPNKHFHLHCTQELPVPLYIPRWACLQTVPCKVWHQRDVASLTLVKYSEHVIGESSGTKIISPINTGISTSTLIKLPKYGPLSNYPNTALYPTTQILPSIQLPKYRFLVASKYHTRITQIGFLSTMSGKSENHTKIKNLNQQQSKI